MVTLNFSQYKYQLYGYHDKLLNKLADVFVNEKYQVILKNMFDLKQQRLIFV